LVTDTVFYISTTLRVVCRYPQVHYEKVVIDTFALLLCVAYQITFSLHDIFPARHDFVNRFSLRTKDGEQISDQINMVIIELSKLNDVLMKPVDQLTSYEKWSLFFKFAPDPVHRNLINDIIKEKEEIGMAATLLREISKDERERAILRSRRMYETDRISDLLTAEERGEIREREKWQVIVADKDTVISDKDAIITGKDAEIANNKAEIADKDSEIARLRTELEKRI